MADEKTPGTHIARLEGDRLQADLDRAISDKMLAASDAGGLLMQELSDSISLALPTLGEMDRSLDPGESTSFSQQDLQSMMSLDRIGEVSVEGMRLNDLLADGGASMEERSMVKRGLLFLSRRLCREAAEWWTLHRPTQPFSNPRLYSLTTLLLALTYQLQGETELAQAEAERARQAMKSL